MLLTLTQDRLAQFMVVVREWRHVKMLKRGGRAHESSGVGGTAQGELAVKCRSCPHLGINLPTNWKESPPEDRWLYSMIVVEDANFKQKARICTILNSDEQGFSDTPQGFGEYSTTILQNALKK